MVTLYVFPPPLLGTWFGFQSVALLQFPVPPFQLEFVCPNASFGHKHAATTAATQINPRNNFHVRTVFVAAKAGVCMSFSFKLSFQLSQQNCLRDVPSRLLPSRVNCHSTPQPNATSSPKRGSQPNR